MDVKARIMALSHLDAAYVLGWLASGDDTTELERALAALDARSARAASAADLPA